MTGFRAQSPTLLVVDDFFADPDQVRAIALTQEYAADDRYFKGRRSTQRFLWPFLKEEFERLLAAPITEWASHDANGCFQQTTDDDPLVWHHDSQSYAGAVYLTPDAPANGGTSFWRDRSHGCRRSPDDPREQSRLGTIAAVEAARESVYLPYNLEHPDDWELVESIAGLYNRLVLWDAGLIHSATSYDCPRLVQLFFFDV